MNKEVKFIPPTSEEFKARQKERETGESVRVGHVEKDCGNGYCTNFDIYLDPKHKKDEITICHPFETGDNVSVIKISIIHSWRKMRNPWFDKHAIREVIKNCTAVLYKMDNSGFATLSGPVLIMETSKPLQKIVVWEVSTKIEVDGVAVVNGSQVLWTQPHKISLRPSDKLTIDFSFCGVGASGGWPFVVKDVL